MKLKSEKFLEIHDSFGINVEPLLSSSFKTYLDKVAQSSPFRRAMITGYVFRCVEEKCIEQKIVRFPDFTKQLKKIEEILEKNLEENQRINSLIDYFDKHHEIGLGKPVKPFTILPYKEAKSYFNLLIEDYIKATYKGEFAEKMRPQEHYYEIIFRNASVGYYYRTAENLILGF